MKKLFSRFIAFISLAIIAGLNNLFKPTGITGFHLKQGGFVTLLRPYAGYQAGQTVEMPFATETALIASGGAVTSAGPATTGALTCSQTTGAGAFAAAASSVVITNPLVNPQTVVYAVINQAAADTTALRIERIVCSTGFFTVYTTAGATATTGFDWAILYQGTATNP